MVKKVISTSSSMTIIVIIVRERMMEKPGRPPGFAEVPAFTLLERPETRPAFFTNTGRCHGICR